MRLFGTLILFAIVGTGTFFMWNTTGVGREYLESLFDSGEFLTLEARHNADQIMAQQRTKLLPGSSHTFLKPSLTYYPYALLEVKFSSDSGQTEEGVVLWGLNDAEMVINTESWETTHGFEDCLNASANRDDYRVINALASSKKELNEDELLKALRVEPATLRQWLSGVQKKQLVVKDTNNYRLHFQQPKLGLPPLTQIGQRLVTKPYKHAKRVRSRYSKSDIERNAKAAFGNDFTVRTHREIFLPVHHIEVKNPDGSIATTYWNALTGQQLTGLQWR